MNLSQNIAEIELSKDPYKYYYEIETKIVNISENYKIDIFVYDGK